MARIPRDQHAGISASINGQDFLRRLATELEKLHRVVFHANTGAEWNLVGQSARQILISEIVTRHKGQSEGVYFALRQAETEGLSWDEAIHALATQMHSYYTTPLGVVLRQNLFGPDAVFFVPEAHIWKQAARDAHANAEVTPT